jgi:hypothetical protein
MPATSVSPAATLIRALGLEVRATAQVQDLYNRPLVRIAVVRPELVPALAAA